MDYRRLLTNLLRLVEVPSITGSPGERELPQVLQKILLEIDFFRNNPDHISLVPLDGDAKDRSLVIAFGEGNGSSSDTVILLSHYDVVDIKDYGSLAELAFQPLELTRRLQNMSLPDEAAQDLRSGNYLFARGIADMKFGLALHIELLHSLTLTRRSLPGNILLLSVPDEEGDSQGMLSAVKELLRLQSQGLKLVAAINSEPHFPMYPADQHKYIYTGTVGKLLPLIFCRGRETHVSEPYAGLNPNLMLAEIIRHIELNPQLAGRLMGSTTPPPVCLKMCDLKTGYSVQTPIAAYAYFNLITLDKSPAQVMSLLKDIVAAALTRTTDHIRTSARLWTSSSAYNAIATWNPLVLSLAEFTELCAQQTGRTAAELAMATRSQLTSTDLREATAEYIQILSQHSPEREPLVVIAFAPPYYPHNYLADSPRELRMRGIAEQVVQRAQEVHIEQLTISPFFPALSDMSYLKLGHAPDESFISSNTPLWGSRYQVPLEAIEQLALPYINIGPLGKDAHQFTERLNLPYSLRVTPDLANHAIALLLNKHT